MRRVLTRQAAEVVACLAMGMLLASASAGAQQARGSGGATAEALGQRKNLADGRATNPTARIQGRIDNRVKTRIDNRLGRNLTPTIGSGVASRYASASNQARNAETRGRGR